jgi:hypothetical protein
LGRIFNVCETKTVFEILYEQTLKCFETHTDHVRILS